MAESWISFDTLISRAVMIEPTPFNLKSHIYNLKDKRKFEEGYIYARRLLEWDPYGKLVDLIFVKSIIDYPELPIAIKKMYLFEGLRINAESPWIKYYISGFLAAEGEFAEAFRIIDSISIPDFIEFNEDISNNAAEYIFFCLKVKKGCFEIKVKIEKIKKMSGLLWREEIFHNRLDQLSQLPEAGRQLD